MVYLTPEPSETVQMTPYVAWRNPSASDGVKAASALPFPAAFVVMGAVGITTQQSRRAGQGSHGG